MKFDMAIAGVGGQGILSIAFVIDNAALHEGLRFKQSEVHGMAQRGGAVVSHLRISDAEIYSDLVPVANSDLILSMEPLESLRYLHYLAADGVLVTSINPVKNIPDYPEEKEVLDKILAFENSIVINAVELARAAGSHHAQNMVMLGAASKLLPIADQSLEKYIEILFRAKGNEVVNTNISAFRAGAQAAAFYAALLRAGVQPAHAAAVAKRLPADDYSHKEIAAWVDICLRDRGGAFRDWLLADKKPLPVDKSSLEHIAALDLSTAKDADFEFAFCALK